MASSRTDVAKEKSVSPSDVIATTVSTNEVLLSILINAGLQGPRRNVEQSCKLTVTNPYIKYMKTKNGMAYLNISL
jgi:hypothetical protein